MTRLRDSIGTRSSHPRSVNVELDRDQQSLDRYIPTGRSLEVISRISESLKTQLGCRSFSVIGPYGSGKSSFAIFLTSLLENHGLATDSNAWKILKRFSPEVHENLSAGLKTAVGTGGRFLVATVTAQREPVNSTLRRCLIGAIDVGGKRLAITPKLLTDFRRENCKNETIINVIREIIERRPLLIGIDEFGKNLEAFSDSHSDSDLFILQQIAELAQSKTSNPLVLLTLQHLSFNEYVSGVSQSGRRELSKIQGRFEEIPYTDSAEQYRRLISEVFVQKDKALSKRVHAWYGAHKSIFSALGSKDLGSDPSSLASFPLHPVALSCLPELCNRFGQNERTLFSFLSSAEPLSIKSYIQETELASRGALPFVRLDRIYDYFVRSASNTVGSAELASRLIEIETRVRDSRGLGAYEEMVLKTIGVLNLVASGGTIRSSGDTLAFSIHDCHLKDDDAAPLRAALDDLENKGLVTFREFADEYRIWNGSDFGIRQRLRDARQEGIHSPLSDILLQSVDLPPLIANRHSQKFGILRAFSRTFEHQVVSDAHLASPMGQFDGSIVYWTGVSKPNIEITLKECKPLLLSEPAIVDFDALKRAAVEAFAVSRVLRDAIAEDADWVAKRELAERKSYADQMLLGLIESTWNSERARWTLIIPFKSLQKWNGGVSRILSDVCDQVYVDSPHVRNETISRRQLTAQGARARRMLSEAILKYPNFYAFKIDGYAPEKSIYEAVFQSTGLHRFSRSDKTQMQFLAPTDQSWVPLHKQIESFLSDARSSRLNLQELAMRLQMPPIGIKEGLINLLFVALLTARSKSVLLYEHGSLVIDFDDAVVERLLKNPSHFAIKNLGLEKKYMAAAVQVVASGLSIATPDRATLLDIARRLYRDIQSLPAYTLSTTRLTSEARDLRKAVKSATELDVLIYETLPQVFGLPVLNGSGSKVPSTNEIETYSKLLVVHLQELRQAYPVLLSQIRQQLAAAFSINVADDMYAVLKHEAHQLSDRVLNKKLKAFVGGILREELSNDEWTENLAMIIADGSPAKSWSEEILTQFEFNLKELSGTFKRLKVLLFEHAEPRTAEINMYRVTVTHQSGYESSTTVSVTKTEGELLREILAEALTRAAGSLGEVGRAKSAIMAMLSEVSNIAEVSLVSQIGEDSERTRNG